MARLSWKLSQGPNNLAQDCVSSKYIHRDKAIPFKNRSKIWKCLGLGWDLLYDNKLWQIGDGKQISVWEDNWLGIGSLRSLIEGPLKNHEQSLKLSELWDHDKWNLNIISFDFPDFILYRIHELTVPPQNLGKSDHPLSSFVEDNKFSLKAAFNALTKIRKPQKNMSWLWNSETTPKIKFFLWLAWWDRLPTNGLLNQRNIIPCPLCPLCMQDVETSTHILRDCRVAHQVWFQSRINTHPINGWLSNQLSDHEMIDNIPACILFTFICWEIWVQRNKFIFENTPIPQPHITIHKALRYAHEFVM